MKFNSVSKWFFLLCMLVFIGCGLVKCSVSYDKKALIINGQRRILISGSIHYPRSTPEVLKRKPFFLFFYFFVNILEKNAVSRTIFFVFRCGKI